MPRRPAARAVRPWRGDRRGRAGARAARAGPAPGRRSGPGRCRAGGRGSRAARRRRAAGRRAPAPRVSSALSRSRNTVHAANRSSRGNAAPAPAPSSTASRGRTHARSPASVTNCVEPRVQPLGDDLAGVRLDQPEPGAHHLGQAPRRPPRRRTTGSGRGASGSWPSARRCTSRTPSRAGTCRPRRRRRGRPVAAARSSVAWNSSLTSRSSGSRPVNGASSPSTRSPAARRRRRRRPPQADRLGLALELVLPGVGVVDRRRGQRPRRRRRPRPGPARRRPAPALRC